MPCSVQREHRVRLPPLIIRKIVDWRLPLLPGASELPQKPRRRASLTLPQLELAPFSWTAPGCLLPHLEDPVSFLAAATHFRLMHISVAEHCEQRAPWELTAFQIVSISLPVIIYGDSLQKRPYKGVMHAAILFNDDGKASCEPTVGNNARSSMVEREGANETWG